MLTILVEEGHAWMRRGFNIGQDVWMTELGQRAKDTS
jgi:hypothetical protein